MHRMLDPYKMRLYVVHIICAKWSGVMAVYGYARVSTDGQSLSAQLAELKAAKCEKIFQEKISGARSDRKQLTRLMGVLAKGDVLDRKSTRLNSSHMSISYAVFCLK